MYSCRTGCLLFVLCAIPALLLIRNDLVNARKYGNEAAAMGSLKSISAAQQLFLEGDKDEDGERDYASLAELGQLELVDKVLGGGTKQGYTFEVVSRSDAWLAVARPLSELGGDRSFATAGGPLVECWAPSVFVLTPEAQLPPHAEPVSGHRGHSTLACVLLVLGFVLGAVSRRRGAPDPGGASRDDA